MQLRTALTIPDCCVRCLKTFRAHHHRLLHPPSPSPMLCAVPLPQSATAEKPATYCTAAMSPTPPLESCRRSTEVLHLVRGNGHIGHCNQANNMFLFSGIGLDTFLSESMIASDGMVQVVVNHVNCMADAALFVALSAAIDLSMDACQLFSRKLRKEFCHDKHDSYS
nr:uncharacterized protein LOC109193052 [Ipomoea batatas]